jgi:hypothetical protein
MDRHQMPSAMPADRAEVLSDRPFSRAEEREQERQFEQRVEDISIDMLTNTAPYAFDSASFHWDEEADDLLRQLAVNAYMDVPLGVQDAADRLGKWLLAQVGERARWHAERKS